MKKQINSTFKAHLVRAASYLLLVSAGTLLTFFRAGPTANASQATLTFAQRVVYQRAIEDVYWHHRIWPKENVGSKPSLDAMMSQMQLEDIVAEYLNNSQALEITGKNPSLPSNYRPRWTGWPGTQNSPKFCANCLRR
jgi:hypothetical protein